MNHTNLMNEVKDAERRGEAAGIARGRREVEWVNKADLDSAWNRGHAWGIVVGSVVGAILLSGFLLAIAVTIL